MTLPRIGSNLSLAEQAYEVLKEAIVNRVLKPGELLNEERLAEELGISRTPLRSALQKLQYEHLVVSAGKGYMVARLSRRDMESVFFMRKLLEPAAARCAASLRTEKDIRLLNDLVRQQVRFVEAGEYLQYLNCDREFHLKIALISQNSYLASAIRMVQLHVHRFLVLDETVRTRAHESLDEHAAIVSAIEAGNGSEAERRVMEHIVTTEERLAQVLHE